MTTRVLKGATHNLYEARSDACHLAMGQLWSVLDHLGCKVGKKRIGESTLRVYPMKFGQYPLLNPLFEPNADHLGAVGLKDCLAAHAM